MDTDVLALAASMSSEQWRQHVVALQAERQAARDEECARSVYGHAEIVLERGERPTCRNCGREPSPAQLAGWMGRDPVVR